MMMMMMTMVTMERQHELVCDLQNGSILMTSSDL